MPGLTPQGAHLALVLIFGLTLVAQGCGPSPQGASSPPAAGGNAPAPSTVVGTPGMPSAAQTAPIQSGPEMRRMRVAYSALWALNAVPWAALDEGLFARHGLDVELRFIASAQTVPAALSGDVDVSFGGGYAAVTSRLGGSDALIVFNLANWSPYELMVTPDIHSAADLRGKALGVSRFGSASDTATRDALRRLGLAPERDVTLIQVGSLQERIAAMKSGAIAGGVAAPPDTVILRRQGFKTLYDLRNSPDKELPNSVFATERWLRANDEVAQRFVDAMIEATHLAKTDREAAEKVLADYLKLEDPEAIADAYEGFVTRMEPAPDLGIEAARSYLQEQAATDPRAAAAIGDPAQFFEARYMDRVRASGLVERLYGGR
ncbi:MAG: ABC transporter substrate-binding protein [Chloroflexi bacterium]|nr:ABC transporter substrate-binding protein [Chloroflexota bacterium]